MSFREEFIKYDWDSISRNIESRTALDVERALKKERLSLDDFATLISPAALPYLETMAARSQALTKQRFGKTIQMFAPMYLSNECNNICTYCGYSFDNKIKRKTLS